MKTATLKKTVTEEKIFQSSDERRILIVNFLEAVRKKLKVIFSVQRLKVLWLFAANSRLAPARL